jgi:hypothetical protein
VLVPPNPPEFDPPVFAPPAPPTPAAPLAPALPSRPPLCSTSPSKSASAEGRAGRLVSQLESARIASGAMSAGPRPGPRLLRKDCIPVRMPRYRTPRQGTSSVDSWVAEGWPVPSMPLPPSQVGTVVVGIRCPLIHTEQDQPRRLGLSQGRDRPLARATGSNDDSRDLVALSREFASQRVRELQGERRAAFRCNFSDGVPSRPSGGYVSTCLGLTDDGCGIWRT